ncbi:hypothetical protein ERJ75_000089800 [Trypanosoma vivax]|nr:hypothetical protein ERJ75_001672100 [Trypanosoma vivax]KAH8620172.1 hypothetical protein ERJ75_000089800 [Trypanosoma vivax]
MASLFQVNPPQGNCEGSRCRTETGWLAETTRLPMGHKPGPEKLHTVARALAGDPEAVSSMCAAPWLIKISVWIGNIRIDGRRKDVEKQGRVATQNVRRCGAALGENNCLIKKREFVGVSFKRKTCTVCQIQKAIRKIREVPPLKGLTVVGSERLTPRMVRAGVRSGALLEHYFSLKEVGRRLSKLNGGLLQLSEAGVPAQKDRQGKRWLWPLLGSKPVSPRRHRPTSATLATDVSMCGWGALLFKGSGEVCVAGGARFWHEGRTASHKVRRVLCHWRSVPLVSRCLKICTLALATQRQ